MWVACSTCFFDNADVEDKSSWSSGTDPFETMNPTAMQTTASRCSHKSPVPHINKNCRTPKDPWKEPRGIRCRLCRNCATHKEQHLSGKNETGKARVNSPTWPTFTASLVTSRVASGPAVAEKAKTCQKEICSKLSTPGETALKVATLHDSSGQKKRSHSWKTHVYIFVFCHAPVPSVWYEVGDALSTSLWTLIISATMQCSTDMLDSASSLDDFWAQAVVQQPGLAEDRSAGSSHQSCPSPLGHSSQRYPWRYSNGLFARLWMVSRSKNARGRGIVTLSQLNLHVNSKCTVMYSIKAMTDTMQGGLSPRIGKAAWALLD